MNGKNSHNFFLFFYFLYFFLKEFCNLLLIDRTNLLILNEFTILCLLAIDCNSN